MRAFFLLLAAISGLQTFASTKLISGTKFPNTLAEGIFPVQSSALALDGEEPHGYTELLPYVLRSPNQDEAGSCLYMSLTGVVEMWLARLHPEISREPDGPIDLSERYMMNVSNELSNSNEIKNWKTDSIYLFNLAGQGVRNVDYRFTKGWFKQDSDGDYVKAKPHSRGSEYGAQYNWIDDRAQMEVVGTVKLPTFRRNVLFADPASDQWDTGVMPDDIVERIKSALVKNRAPVQVIYNHFGYWHSTIIVGFDDDGDNQNCQFVHAFLRYMKRPGDPKKKLAYERAQAAYERGGGCHPRGIFYVRDSIYADKKGPVYHYDIDDPSHDAPYAKSVVMLEYDWVRYMGNHAIQILAN